jgi:tetratricopeptide (TPR) repeat protein
MPTAAVRLTSQAIDKEAEWQAVVKKGFNPGAFEEFKKHFDATQHLGLLYVDQRRLDEAEAFFKNLRDKPPHDTKIYSGLGKIGLGLVLAYQNKPTESNQVFLEIEKQRPQFGEKGKQPGGDWKPWMGRGPREFSAEAYLLAQPTIRRAVAEALSYNLANLDAPLPDALERLRRPSPQPFGRPPFEPSKQ